MTVASLLDNIASCRNQSQLVIAGAGTGKTHTLINTVLTRLNAGRLDPGNHNETTVIFTFTNNAAAELMAKLIKVLPRDSEVINSIYIGTIHGWCSKYLDRHHNLSNTKVIDEFEQLQLLQRLYPLLGLDTIYKGNTQFTNIEKFRRDLELLYNEHLAPTDPRIPDTIQHAFTYYLQFLTEQRLIDFGSQIRNASNTIQTNLHTRTHHIFVDEYQDVNNAQVELIKQLLATNNNCTLFAVGDPRQAIYQWRGGNIKHLLRFSADFSDTALFQLHENRRSRPGIVSFANVIAGALIFPESIPIAEMSATHTNSDKDISVVINNRQLIHHDEVVNTIQQLHSEGTPYSSIAVLLRSVLVDGPDLMLKFDEASIPYYSPSKNAGISFIKEFMLSVISLIALMEDQPQNRSEEQELLESINECLNLIQPFCSANRTIVHTAVSTWHKTLVTPARILANKSQEFHNEQYNFRRQLFDFCSTAGLTISPTDPSLHEGFAAITQIMRAIEEIYRRRFKGISVRQTPYYVFSKNLRWHLTYHAERWGETGTGLLPEDKVTISTVHAAKGLEWPIVILPYAFNGMFPRKSALYENSISEVLEHQYGTNAQDERRLWYVAVTRAIDRLYVFAGHASKRSDFTHQDTADNFGGVRIVGTRAHAFTMSKIKPYARATYRNISVSNFILLLECPLAFHLRYIAKINVPVGDQFGAGNILHKVIQRLHREGTQNSDAIIKDEVYLPLSEIADEEAAALVIAHRIATLKQLGVLLTIDASEYAFAVSIGGVIVSGIIDATIKHQNGLELVDWKSTIHGEFETRYENQIRMYAYALRHANKIVSKATLWNLTTTGDHNPEIAIDIGTDIINHMVHRAHQSLMEINRGSITPTPSKAVCKLCDVKEICRARAP